MGYTPSYGGLGSGKYAYHHLPAKVRKYPNAVMYDYTKATGKYIYQRTHAALVKAAHHLNESIKLSLMRHYVKSGQHHKGVIKGRSKPGEIPWFETGKLHKSFKSKSYGQQGDILMAGIESKSPYAKALEYGNPSNNLAPRPFIRPALAREMPTIQKIFIDYLGMSGNAPKVSQLGITPPADNPV